MSTKNCVETNSKVRHRLLVLLVALGGVAVLIGGLTMFDTGPVSPAQAQTNPIEISNWTELNTTVRENPDGEYVLVNDLNQSTPGYAQVAGPSANGGGGFLPIGDASTPFSGSFDGQGNTIRDFVIDRTSKNRVGLFGESGGTITNITISNATVRGLNRVGGLVGQKRGGAVTNVRLHGNVTGAGLVGGLIRVNTGPVTDAQATSNVSGELSGADQDVGGLIGENFGTVIDASASGTVTTTQSSGTEAIGGLVGENFQGRIIDTSATGDVIAPNGTDVGGLVGYTGRPGSGSGVSEVRASDATGTVEGDKNVGGLIGRTFGDTVSNNQADGDVTGTENVGGLIGRNEGVSEFQSLTVEKSHATGDVTGMNNTGGLIGINIDDTVRNTYALGDVTGKNQTGGLIGRNEKTTPIPVTVEESFAAGDVTGGLNTGGLIGDNLDDTVNNTYALGDVTGNTNTGGLVGSNIGGAINSSFAVGSVSGPTATGGLVGANKSDATVTGSYWDTETTGQADSAGSGATGLPTNEMRGVTPTAQGADTMSAFAFDRDGGSEWFAVVAGEQINPTPENDCYPILQALDISAQLDAQDICEEQAIGLGEFEVVAITNETPIEVAVDESFDVQYTVENVGDETGRQEIRLELNGTEVANKPDTLTPGQAVTNSFTDVTLPEDAAPGDTVELTVRTNNDAQTQNLTVTGVQAPALTDYANEDDVIDITGVSNAISDWQNGQIGIGLISDVIAAWQSGDPVT